MLIFEMYLTEPSRQSHLHNHSLSWLQHKKRWANCKGRLLGKVRSCQRLHKERKKRESDIFMMTKDKKVKSHRFFFTLRFEAGHWFLGMMQKFPALRPTFWHRNSTNFTPPTRQKPQSRTLGTAQYGHVNSNWPNKVHQ